MATVNDIAKIAGVSPGLVSLALNGKPRVNRNTAEKIIRIARELGYRRPVERVPRAGSLKFIRCIKSNSLIRDSHAAFFADYIEGAEHYLNERGYRFEVASFAGDRLEDILRLLDDPQLQGAIILATELSPVDIQVFEPCILPLVFLDACHDFLPYDYCTMNNLDAVFQVMGYLYELGHRRIGMVGSSVPTSNFAGREAAYVRALEAYGLEADGEWILHVRPDAALAEGDLAERLAGRPLPGAFFCLNDNLAYGCLRALAALGKRVPEDVSVVGFDDLSPSRVMQPPLTTASVPTRAMGRAAARLLNARVLDPEKPIEKVSFSCELTIRKSACAVPAE